MRCQPRKRSRPRGRSRRGAATPDARIHALTTAAVAPQRHMPAAAPVHTRRRVVPTRGAQPGVRAARPERALTRRRRVPVVKPQALPIRPLPVRRLAPSPRRTRRCRRWGVVMMQNRQRPTAGGQRPGVVPRLGRMAVWARLRRRGAAAVAVVQQRRGRRRPSITRRRLRRACRMPRPRRQPSGGRHPRRRRPVVRRRVSRPGPFRQRRLQRRDRQDRTRRVRRRQRQQLDRRWAVQVV